MRTRLKKGDREKAAVREQAIEQVVKWPSGARRAEAIRRMAVLCGLSEKSCYRLVKAWETARATGGNPSLTLERKSRSDAGAPRAGGEELRRDAAWLRGTGATELAARQAEAAARAARELKQLWCQFCVERGQVRQTTMLRRLFAERYPELRLPSDSRLREWRKEIDPALGMTNREMANEFRPRGRVEAKYPNHVWLADQHVADVFVWYRDPRTREIRPKRPTLFTFVDRFTGLPMYGEYGWHYTTEHVALCLWQAMLPDYERDLPWSGLPEHIYWDRGDPHWSEWMVTTCGQLGIETHKGEAYQWASHGFIEGWHSILHHQFEELLPGYAGSDHQEGEQPLEWRRYRAGEGPCPVQLDLEALNEKFHGWRRWLADQPYQDGTRTRQQLYDWQIGERGKFPSWETFPLAILKQETRKPDDEGCITVHGLEYQGWPLNELKGQTVWIAFLPGHMGNVWVLSADRQAIRGIVPLRRPDLFGTDPALAAARARMAAGRQGVKRTKQYLRAVEALARRGEVAPEEAEQAAGVLTRLAAVQKEEVTTVEALAEATALPDNVVTLRPRVVAEEQKPEEAEAAGVLGEVLASAARQQGAEEATVPRPTGVFGGLLD